ncbi:putative baseplate assembly protein [Caulobacter endophyticus]|uniref:Putative baseplate assembly protein n=1 Tax=Caulobacter endophyticus TaxID=2172652 RepID=A0A2T9JEQ1_9CAUL|nr:putative baseplate assembly protein [Caulobacter endophyticus]PVM82174.1 putative baseplate assembly protein [Caulobacter endophyticus]
MISPYVSCDPRRREAVLASKLNGLDYVEVLDADAPSRAERQKILRVHFLKSPPPPGLTPANVLIDGGDRIRSVGVRAVDYDGDVVVLRLDAYGDHSTYRLALRASTGSAFDAAGVDPVLAQTLFSFKSDCPNDFDCEAPTPPSAPAPAAPQLDYLSRDFTSLRQLMLDRMSVLAPQWTERNPADIGVTLVELFAHVGDVLSYRQDAVATEAYLGTARRRVSVRRHARLVDYVIGDGVNARTFLHIRAEADAVAPRGVQALTSVPNLGERAAPGAPEVAQAMGFRPEVFETLHDAAIFTAHNQITFHAWGDRACRLPAGATRATLSGGLDKLAPGDVVLFEEVLGRASGLAADADPARRHAVRLTRVSVGSDPLGDLSGAKPKPLAITEIEWGREDATPFSFQISAEIRTESGGVREAQNITVVRGNMVLADHGATVVTEDLGTAPAPSLFRQPASTDPCAPVDPVPIPARFRPRLARRPLVFAVPYDADAPPVSARAALATTAGAAQPAVQLAGVLDGASPVPWIARRDLLQSEPDARDFVVETENDGSAWLRFGDDVLGQRPAAGTAFAATYRVGEAVRGNLAADTIRHILSDDAAVAGVRNPLPASGGVAPESLEHVRQTAPFAFRNQQRAVTPEDYQAAAERHPEVQRATASFRWTGSWPTVFVTIDRLGGLAIDAGFEQAMREFLEPYRLAGHDLEIDAPTYVSLDIALTIAAKPDYFRADVKRAVLDAFSSGRTLDGRRGVFNPDNFTFGQPVYLSAIYAAAQAVDGVASVEVTRFQRQDRPAPPLLRLQAIGRLQLARPLRAQHRAMSQGRLDFTRLEIPRLDNDPDHPERGVFTVTMEGGK